MNDKIVFFDIDGTLLDHDKKIPQSTRDAVKQLQEKGVHVAIATGRAPFMFEDIRKELDIHNFKTIAGVRLSIFFFLDAETDSEM